MSCGSQTGIVTSSPPPKPSASATPSPSPTASPTPTSSLSSPTASASPSPGVTIDEQCGDGSLVLDGRVLVLGSLTPAPAFSPPQISLLDVTNPLAPRQLCMYGGLPGQVRLMGSSELSYAADLGNANPSDGLIGTFDIPRAVNQTVVQWQNGGFGAGQFAWSPDGTLAYIMATAGTQSLTGAGSWEIHLVRQGQDRVLTTLPGVGGRGISADDDDTFLAFSPDGQYLALEETFTGSTRTSGGAFQVRRVSDGSLVASPATPATMAIWAGQSVFYRDQAGVHRWELNGTSRLVLPGVSWIRPHASPDGKWIAYTVRDSTGLPQASLYNASAGSRFRIASGGRDGAIFLSSTVLWEREVRLCSANDQCGMSQAIPTGVTFTYDLATRQETRSTLTAVTDVWPRMD